MECREPQDPQEPMYEKKKMFIGGLSWNTTVETMTEYFSKFGEVEHCSVVTGKDVKGNIVPRGFGFVTFVDDESVVSVLQSRPTHVLDNKSIDPKRANVKGTQHNRRVFIGGLPMDATEDDVKESFIMHGYSVDEVKIKMDHDTQRSRGFCFLDFNSVNDSERACGIHSFKIKDKDVEVKRAVSKGATNSTEKKYHLQPAQITPSFGTTYSPYPGAGDNGRFSSSQYSNTGSSYQQFHPHYHDYQYGQQPTPQVYSTYGGGSNYGGHGYNAQHQASSFGQGTSYPQPRSSFGSNRGDSYSQGASSFNSYDQGYNSYYGDQSTETSTPAYSRMSNSSNSVGGQTRGGTSGYQYSSH